MITGACSYCGERAVNADHVVPKSFVKKWQKTHGPIPMEFLGTVPSCLFCNVRKGARRLVPASWSHKVDALNRFFGGVPFRVWNGDPMSDAYRETWMAEVPHALS
jgi:hypothetical protein